MMFSYIKVLFHIPVFYYYWGKEITHYTKDRVVIKSRGRGFSPATKRVAPSYFYWKIEEK